MIPALSLRCRAALLGLCLPLAAASAAALPAETAPPLARELFKQLIEINTTDSVGNVSIAAEAMAQRLREAGFPAEDVQVLGPNERKRNLVVRYRGTGLRKPVLIIGHLDVVEARREDWTTDPFTFVEQDGYYYGRGTQDMKAADAIMVANFIRLHQEGWRPERDLILALTADEEGGQSNGVDWLIRNHRDLIEADFVLNPDSGGLLMQDGRPLIMTVEATEKVYADFQLTVTNAGGHSSLPKPDNAIYHLADALGRLSRAPFPFELNAVTRRYFERMAPRQPPQVARDMRAILKAQPDAAAIARLSQDPLYNSTLHTTCVATRLEAGHANNALPQRATANVNCRILPGHSPEDVRQELIRRFKDPQVQVRYVSDSGAVADVAPERKAIAPPPPRPEVFEPLEALVAEMWPGTPVVPNMETGASDSIYTAAVGWPSYGVSGIALEQNDIRAHGRDERVPVASFERATTFYYRYLKALTAPAAAAP